MYFILMRFRKNVIVLV